MEGQEIEEIGEDSQMTIEAKFRQTSPKQKLLSQIETSWRSIEMNGTEKGEGISFQQERCLPRNISW